jgi:hypothetical protein
VRIMDTVRYLEFQVIKGRRDAFPADRTTMVYC